MKKSTMVYTAAAAIILVSIMVLIFNRAKLHNYIPLPNENRTEQQSVPEVVENMTADIFAQGLGKPRMMAVSPNGVLLLSITKQGRVVALPDKNNDGKADEIVDVIKNLNLPHGLAFHNNDLYIAETDKIIRLNHFQNDFTYNSKETILAPIPQEGSHFTRTIVIGPDNKLYISVGSSCNVCIEKHSYRAAILQADLDGGLVKVFAKGMRNAVGMTFHPETGKLWATENGRDWLGDERPPDEINIVRAGDYGWPLCFGKQIHDTDFDKNVYARSPCEDTIPSLYDLQAHGAPLGLRFSDKSELFVALHGSWNRKEPVGYEVIKLEVKDSKIISEHKILDSSNLPNKPKKFRPVDIIFGKNGEMYVSDDENGIIYVANVK